MARFKWYLDPSSPHQLNKKNVKVGPLLAKFSGSAHVLSQFTNLCISNTFIKKTSVSLLVLSADQCFYLQLSQEHPTDVNA